MGFDPSHLALLKNNSALLPFTDIITKKDSYRLIRLDNFVSVSKSPLYHCAVVSMQSFSNLFLSSNASCTGLGVARFNLDHSCVFAVFGSPSDGCIVQSYPSGLYISLMKDSDASANASKWVLGLSSRASVVKLLPATGDVVSSSKDVFSMHINDSPVMLQKGLLIVRNNPAAADAANVNSLQARKIASNSSQNSSASSVSSSFDIANAAKPFTFSPVLPGKFNILLSSSRDLAWFYSNSRIRLKIDSPESFLLLHEFPVFDPKRGLAKFLEDVGSIKGCEVRRIAKSSEITAVQLIILDEKNLKVAFQHRNLFLSWCIAPNGSAVVFWAEMNPHRPHNNSHFYFELVREGGTTKVKILILDDTNCHVLAVRPNAGTDNKTFYASFVASKDHSGSNLSVVGSEAHADFDLSSLLLPGSIVSLKVVVELAENKGANVLLTHRGNCLFCDERCPATN
jgi:hypothetical protein